MRRPGQGPRSRQERRVRRSEGVRRRVLLANPAVEIVGKTTVQKVHAGVALATHAAGKQTYGEMPLATNRRELIDEGAVGEPVAAMALRDGHAPESWNASPEFYNGTCGGTMFDMGPYHRTALVNPLDPDRGIGLLAHHVPGVRHYQRAQTRQGGRQLRRLARDVMLGSPTL
jgi:predicted dehydrogenase